MTTTEQFIAALNSPDWWTRIHAEVELRSIGAAAVAPLVALVGDTAASVEARWRAEHALGMIGDQAAIPALIEALRDPSSDVQYFAAWALGVLGDPRAFEALRGVLNSTRLEEQANYAAAISMIRIDREQGLRVLRDALNDENEAARRVALGALASAE